MQDKNQKTEIQEKVEATINRAAQGDFVRKIADKIKSSENILVALSRNPSVDEISAAIGLTLFLDDMQKHTTAIYSGRTPDALAFLKPEETFETNTDSLQDFIIALSKDKADHLRYKLEGDFVKVYITPYKAKIGQEDLTFSQGDYNVDFVIALNVPSANELDEALAEHGRIMHDASAVDITRGVPGKFGEIEWSNPAASSVSEMVTELIFKVQGSDKKLDVDVATALLTGIVAATERFSNNRTTPETLSLASKLMEMGANQQLISANVVDNQKLGNGEAPAVVVDDIGMMADFGTPVKGRVNPAIAAAEMTANEGGMADVTMTGENPAAQMAGVEGMSAVPEAPITATNQVMPEDVDVQPVLPETANETMAEATASAMPSVDAMMNEVVARVATDTTGMAAGTSTTADVPLTADGKKDYARMLEQALAEADTMGQAVPAQPVQAQPIMQPQMTPGVQAQPAPVQQAMQQQAAGMSNVQTAPMAGAQTVGAQSAGAQAMNQPMAGQPMMPNAQPVANPYAEVLPPPPAPTAGPDMMPPSLPPVQMPAGA